MNAGRMLQEGRRGFILLGTEPELDSIDGKSALNALVRADFVVQVSAFRSESVMAYADVLLPMAAFAEAAGTFVNCEGRSQQAKVAASPKGEARPAWKILRVMGNFLELPGFDYITLDDVTAEAEAEHQVSDAIPRSRLAQWRMETPQSTNGSGMQRLTDMPMYRGDVTLRHADALQQTADNPPPAARVNPATIADLGLSEGIKVHVKNESGSALLPLTADGRVPQGAVYIPAGFAETTGVGGHASVTLEKEGA